MKSVLLSKQHSLLSIDISRFPDLLNLDISSNFIKSEDLNNILIQRNLKRKQKDARFLNVSYQKALNTCGQKLNSMIDSDNYPLEAPYYQGDPLNYNWNKLQ